MVAEAVATIALGLLGVGGVAKVVDPEPTAGALRAARLPSTPTATRLLGFFEIAVAVVGLAVGEWTLAGSAALYGAFTIFTLAAVRGDIPVQSCGCFGRAETPPSLIHVTYNLIASVALIVVALTSNSVVPWNAPLIEVLLYLWMGGVGVFASTLILTRLPIALRSVSL